MSNYLRKNAWDANNGGQFTDKSNEFTALFWYAKAVQVMQSRPIENPTSWWFYAAIHGEFLINEIKDPNYKYLNWKNISYISPKADLTALPSSNLVDSFWDQCQHGTWFFPPWHRGYLVALENILRDIIINELSGPNDWSLPYWNYLNQSTAYAEFKIPPAFTESSLPDGTANPLYVPERYGPTGNSDIYVQVGPNIKTSANDECQWNETYSASAANNASNNSGLFGQFYGGGETGFSHGGSETGDLEMNPHNFVHGMVGGESNSNNQNGLMGVPATAALDPIFYLHHANIDRMWAAWNQTGKNNNTANPNWLHGPTAQGDRRFEMPIDPSGTAWPFTPEDVNSTEHVNYNGQTYTYTYDDLSLTSYETIPPTKLHEKMLERFSKLGVRTVEKDFKMTKKRNPELVGASSGSLTLNSKATKTQVKLQSSSWKSVSNSIMKASVSKIPDEVYLQLEGVKGGSDSNFISVYVNEKFVKSISLFGLLAASMTNAAHGNSGLNFKFNITEIVDDLHLENDLNMDSLNVEIKTKNPLVEGKEITVDRIGIYRVGQ